MLGKKQGRGALASPSSARVHSLELKTFSTPATSDHCEPLLRIIHQHCSDPLYGLFPSLKKKIHLKYCLSLCNCTPVIQHKMHPILVQTPAKASLHKNKHLAARKCPTQTLLAPQLCPCLQSSPWQSTRSPPSTLLAISNELQKMIAVGLAPGCLVKHIACSAAAPFFPPSTKPTTQPAHFLCAILQ